MSTEKKEFTLCKKCHAYRTPEEFLNAKGRTMKTCIKCREYGKKMRNKNRCEHNRSKYTCKMCKQLKKEAEDKKKESTDIDLSNVENEQKPIINYDCVDGCPYCTPELCNITHPGCICKRIKGIVIKKNEPQGKVSHKIVKKAYADYVRWLNKVLFTKFNQEQIDAIKCLREFWNINNHSLDEYYDIKKHHTLINGYSGNNELWDKYINLAMRLRLTLTRDLHNN